ncbi:hypothetical protein LAG90_14995 [Marinilongibacter aquaticus]|uniref:hypothetical protein n=1 Tax=Marinilongibacter aquaticus TaxID=2975157 RepID=UPI0021BDC9D9|nr:hypothetical protein [Marinilongibacter aquaticus]UBM58111.1 hypothetical protein LAG90_14995 [Marinilongibacter aquaticus]
MTQTFTTKQNDVVRYLYQETTPQENLEIEANLAKDERLLDFYLESLELMADMDKIKLMPSSRVVNSVLAFSKNYVPAH